jgi:hypothetical protein
MTLKAYCTRWCDPSLRRHWQGLPLHSTASTATSSSHERPNIVRGAGYSTDSCFPCRRPCLGSLLANTRHQDQDPLLHSWLPLTTYTVISGRARQLAPQSPTQQLYAGAVIRPLIPYGDCPKTSFGQGIMAESRLAYVWY